MGDEVYVFEKKYISWINKWVLSINWSFLRRKKMISYQKIKNSSKAYYWVLRQKKNVVKKLITSLYNWLFNMFLQA